MYAGKGQPPAGIERQEQNCYNITSVAVPLCKEDWSVTDQERRPVGRPSKYNEDYAKQASKLCELGATDAELADFFGVSVSTLNLWKIEHKDFSESLKLGKSAADERVKRALYNRAVGYSHQEDDIRAVNGEIVITPTIKHYPPDSTACFFWLKNRLPDEFRANPELAQVAGIIHVMPVPTASSVEDWEAAAAIVQQKNSQ